MSFRDGMEATMKVRVSIDKLRANSNQGTGNGLRCPKCNCLQFADGKNVRNTVPGDNQIRRYRVCRCCGTSWSTTEQ